ncbi:Mss4-like protein [Xylariaceae sp. FL1651]|nr:Mss4-like protein [Xylariaceae sp. FL1651]
MASSSDFPKPKYVTGGCLCESLTYRIDFPDGHNFEESSKTCQCTQCRKNTGSLFYPAHSVSQSSAFRWTGASTDTLGHYRATPDAERGFCTRCGSFMYWKRIKPGADNLSVAVGTIDPLFLFGEGADGVEVPKGGFGMALANGAGGHEWCDNEIPGITDKMGCLSERGRRWPKDFD